MAETEIFMPPIELLDLLVVTCCCVGYCVDLPPVVELLPPLGDL